MPSFARIGTGVALRLSFATWCVVKVIVGELRCLLYPAITMEQTAEERNLLYLSVSVLRIWQYHSAIEPCVGGVVIPVFQVFFDGKPELMFVGEDYFVKAFSFDCPDEVFHP